MTAEPTAEDHIREAQRLLELGGHDEREPWLVASDTARAQVHATLAQTLKAAELMPAMAGIAGWITAGCPAATPPAVAPDAVLYPRSPYCAFIAKTSPPWLLAVPTFWKYSSIMVIQRGL